MLAPEDRWNELNAQVERFFERDRFAQATALAQESLRIAKAAFGTQHPRVAKSFNNLALLYKIQGRFAQAERLYTRAIAIYENESFPSDPALLGSLNNLGVLYYDQGRYAQAESLYKRALAIDEKALGREHPDVATDLNKIAQLCYEQGRFAEAERLYTRALAIREKARGPDHPDVAESLNDLGVLYCKHGRFAEAERFHTRALAIREKALGPDHPYVATSLNNLALVYKEQGRYGDARPLYERALAIDERAPGRERNVAADLNNLAVMYDDQGRYAKAEPLFKRVLAIHEKVLGPENPEVATALNNLAAIYDDQGRYAEAERLHKRSLAIRERALGPDHPDVASSLNNLALVYKEKGRYADAKRLYKRALAIAEKALGPDHPHVATDLNNLALLFYRWARPAQAAPLFDRAFDALAKQFRYYFTYMIERERLALLARVQYRFPQYFSFCLTYRQQVPELAGKMYDTVLWQKGFIAQSVAAMRTKIMAQGDAEALRLLDELAAMKSELAKLATAPAKDEAQKQVERRVQIEQLEKEANELEGRLVRRSRALAEEKRLARVTWRQVRDALKPDEAAVEVVRFDFYDGKKWTRTCKYVALIVTAKSTQPQFVVLGDAKELEGDPLRDYRLRVGINENRAIPGVNVMGAQSEKYPAIPTTSFYESFWQPLESVIGGVRRVYVSTDGVLNQVALGVAPDNAGHLLMEKYDLRIVSNTKDLLRQRHRRPSRENTAVVMGNPLFDLDEAQQRVAVRALRLTRQTEKTKQMKAGKTVTVKLAGAQRLRDLRTKTLDPLPETQKEAKKVSKLLRDQHWNVGLYTRKQALEERVKGVQGPRVLHLATHGFFESDQEWRQRDLEREGGAGYSSGLEDPMLRSGLYLTGANRTLEGMTPPADMDDGVLTAYEATLIDLQGTELVVLSACETGLGELRNGEGVFGLRRAFQEAGAEAVLMSMWSVPDRETQELMTSFYRNWLSRKDKHEALREAQRTMRATVKARYGRDLPYSWGAFVLVGR
ncbi:MAG TPA: CHAT domain-containing tetratricopeptide repeat protein [Terriglobales bacterium]|nr:CHAT domain-containing tetratricopeptide repeat protein [Terriglobales bacterium]